MGTVNERVERAQAWIAARGATDLNARDVIVIAALDVHSREVAATLALANPQALLAAWEDVVGAAAESAPVVPAVLVEHEARPSRKGRSEASEDLSPPEPPTAQQPAVPTPSSAPAAAPLREQPATYIPGVTEAAPAPATAPVERDAGQVDMSGFAEYAWGDQPGLGDVATLTFALEDDRIRVSWPPADAAHPSVVVYRVVAAMDGEPYTPNKDVIAATTSLSIIDENPRQDPYQHVQVWASVGGDIGSAKAAQPVLHARGLMVLPPSSFDIVANEGQVVGRWHVADDVAVDVMWIEAAYSDRVTGFEPTRRLESVVQGGFTHHESPSGQRLEYRAVARVERVGGDGQTRHGVSPHVSRFVETPAVIEAVNDLTVESSALDSSLLDISWTSPASGSVDI